MFVCLGFFFLVKGGYCVRTKEPLPCEDGRRSGGIQQNTHHQVESVAYVKDPNKERFGVSKNYREGQTGHGEGG